MATEATTARQYFEINGFWKDDKVKFNGHIVSNQDEVEEDKDEDIFFYGLSEIDTQEAIEKGWNTDHEFVITSYTTVK